MQTKRPFSVTNYSGNPHQANTDNSSVPMDIIQKMREAAAKRKMAAKPRPRTLPGARSALYKKFLGV